MFNQNAKTLEQVLPRSTPEIEKALSRKSLPWYVQLLILLSSQFAAGLFVGALAISEIISLDRSAGFFMMGLLYLGAALLVRYAILSSEEEQSAGYLEPILLSFALAGEFLILVGSGIASEDETVVFLVGALMELILVFAYPDSIHRILSVLLASLFLMGLLWSLKAWEFYHLVILILAGGACLLWSREEQAVTHKLNFLLRPLLYGLPVALLGFLLFLVALPTPEVFLPFPWVSTLIGAGLLLYLEYTILSELEMGPSEAPFPALILMGGSLLFCVITMWSPEIVMGLLIMLLGFRVGERKLTALGIVFLSAFIFYFYYNLQFNLLNKSLVLMGSGLFLLLIWTALKYIPTKGQGATHE